MRDLKNARNSNTRGKGRNTREDRFESRGRKPRFDDERAKKSRYEDKARQVKKVEKTDDSGEFKVEGRNAVIELLK